MKEAEKAMDRLAQAEEQAEHIRVQQEEHSRKCKKPSRSWNNSKQRIWKPPALAQEEYEQAKLTREQDMANTGSPERRTS